MQEPHLELLPHKQVHVHHVQIQIVDDHYQWEVHKMGGQSNHVFEQIQFPHSPIRHQSILHQNTAILIPCPNKPCLCQGAVFRASWRASGTMMLSNDRLGSVSTTAHETGRWGISLGGYSSTEPYAMSLSLPGNWGVDSIISWFVIVYGGNIGVLISLTWSECFCLFRFTTPSYPPTCNWVHRQSHPDYNWYVA